MSLKAVIVGCGKIADAHVEELRKIPSAELCAVCDLEPIMAEEVEVPEEYMGDVIGNLNSRRGRIENMEERAGAKVITSKVPLAEMFAYSTTLRSMSQGRGTYTMQFSHYDEAPRNVAEEIIAKARGTK